MSELRQLNERIAKLADIGNTKLRDPAALDEKSQPKLNKYDPGSLLGWCIHLLDKEGLDDVADEVKEVSRHVSKAWQGREK